LIFCLFFSSCFAKKGSSSDSQEQRDVKIDTQDGDHIIIRSDERNGKTKSRIQFEMRTNNGELEWRVNYFTKTADSNARFEVRVAVQQVIEYLENNGQKGYQPADATISSIDFLSSGKSSNFWNPIACVAGSASNSYDCAVLGASGQVQAIVHILGDTGNVNGIPVHPTSIKFDINIDYANKRNNTNLAVVVATRSKEHQVEKSTSSEQDSGFTTNKEKQVSFGDNGFFSWATTASVAGVTGVEVYNEPLASNDNDGGLESGESGHRLVFSFQSTAVGPILWDPKLSVSSSVCLIPSFGLLLLALITLKFF